LFQENLRKILLEYFNRASKSERATCIQLCLKGGYADAAAFLRRT